MVSSLTSPLPSSALLFQLDFLEVLRTPSLSPRGPSSLTSLPRTPAGLVFLFDEVSAQTPSPNTQPRTPCGAAPSACTPSPLALPQETEVTATGYHVRTSQHESPVYLLIVLFHCAGSKLQAVHGQTHCHYVRHLE